MDLILELLNYTKRQKQDALSGFLANGYILSEDVTTQRLLTTSGGDVYVYADVLHVIYAFSQRQPVDIVPEVPREPENDEKAPETGGTIPSTQSGKNKRNWRPWIGSAIALGIVIALGAAAYAGLI